VLTNRAFQAGAGNRRYSKELGHGPFVLLSASDLFNDIQIAARKRCQRERG